MKTSMKRLLVPAVAALLCCVTCSSALAQSSTNDQGYGATTIQNLRTRNSATRFSVNNIQTSLRARSVPGVGAVGVNRRNFLGTTSPSTPRAKPFSGLKSGPTVNPYLALSSPRASASDYYDIIQPQQQRQRDNERQQIQAIQQQRRLNQLAARAPFSQTGDEMTAPTGHVAVFQSLGSFQNTGNYFPPPSPPKRR